MEILQRFKQSPKKKCLAFTLAEVLITLGIIGVVAAMTIPTLAAKIQKSQLEAQVKVNYTSIMQTLRFAEDDGVEPVPISNNSIPHMKQWFDAFLSKHMKVESVCFQQAGCWHKKGVVKTLDNNTPFFETTVGLNDSTLGWATMTFRTAKGAYYNLDGSTSGTTRGTFGVNTKGNSMQFYFDANGDKKPNVIGKDIYIMIYAEDVGFVPAGYSKTRDEVDNNCLKGNGYWCLSKLIRDGWVIDDRVWKR